MLVEVADHLLVDLSDQHHLHHGHGLLIGNPHPLDEPGDDAVALEGLVDLRAAAMDDDRIDPQRLEHDHIQGERLLQLFIRHGVAAVLDDKGLTGEPPDIRQRFHQGFCFLDQVFHHVSLFLIPENGSETDF